MRIFYSAVVAVAVVTGQQNLARIHSSREKIRERRFFFFVVWRNSFSILSDSIEKEFTV
jgi:hypothetical protein